MDQLASGNFVLGGYHFSLAVYADSQEQLSITNLAAARAELSKCGVFVTTKEDLAVCSAYYAQLPGNWQLPYSHRQSFLFKFPWSLSSA